MLKITIPARKPDEQWDEVKQEFILIGGSKEQTLELEHSLVSLSKWESKWHKPFVGKENKTAEETIDYVKCMTLTKNVDPNVYNNLTAENIEEINNYIGDSMTATTFSKVPNAKTSHEVMTAEVIYYYMIALTIPFECQKWHLNRLLTLIEVCNRKNSPPKKMSKGDLMRRNAALNASRRAKYNTKG